MKSVYFSKQIVLEDKYFYITLELNCYIEVYNHVIGLGELTGQVQSKNERKKTPLYLCCDVCDESNVQDMKMPVLRQIIRSQGGNITSTLNNMIWLKVNRSTVKRIRLYIADINGELQSLSNCLLNGTLLFKNEETNC